MYWTYMSDDGRSDAQKWPRPFGLRPKSRDAALQALTMEKTMLCGSRLAPHDFGQQRSDQT
jgi:hypothetical protein